MNSIEINKKMFPIDEKNFFLCWDAYVAIVGF